MIEKQKKNSFYFSHDSNSRSDEKVIALRMKHDWKGYGLFWAIIEKLSEANNYTCVRDYNIIAYDLRTDASTIKSIIEDFGLFTFTEDSKCFCSERLNRAMDLKNEKSIKARNSAIKRWEEEKETDTNAIQTQCDSNANKGKESKVKESKEKEDIVVRKLKFSSTLKPFFNLYGEEVLNSFCSYWTEPNKSNTKFRQELEKTWDLKRRLETWVRNDKYFKKNENGKSTNTNGKTESFGGRQSAETIAKNLQGWE